MLTHLIKSINWIDVILLCLFAQMVYNGVKNGFISEFFKFLGVVTAVFVTFHFYSSWAAWLAQKTNFNTQYWEAFVFVVLWIAVVLIFRLIRQGIIFLFKIETAHEGFDKYAGGAVGVARGILVCSLAIFLVILWHNGVLTRMALRSFSYKVVGHAGVGTYSFLYKNLVDKLLPAGHYNTAGERMLVEK